ncbi:MAG TPA: LEA type 2 family protein [Gammaproteobacteria bacterium]
MYKNVSRTLLVSASLLLLGACAALQEVVKEPKVSVEDMLIKGVSFSDMQLDFVLGVENPNPVGISLSGLSYNLDVEGKSLVAGESRERLKVAANGNGRMTLPLSLKYEEVFGGLEAMFKQETIRYNLSGDLDFGLFRLPYSKQGVIELPSLPEVSIEKVAIDRMTLSGLDIGVALKLNNSNRFPIKLDGLDYGLKLGGTTVASGKSLGPISLPAGESGTMNFGLSLGYGELAGVIDTLRNSSRIPVAFDGKLQLPGAESVPLQWQGDVGISR